MSLRAPLLLAAIMVAGCTRLNGAFLDGDTDTVPTDTAPTDAAPTSGGDPTRSTTEGSSPTTGDSTGSHNPTESGLTTGHPTGSATGANDPSGGDACLEILGDSAGCDPYSAEGCDQGQCRPYGDFGDLSGVGCVRQDRRVRPAGETCSHSCAGQLGKDACASRSICDPFSNTPGCVLLCSGTEGTPACPPDFSCFSHVAGQDSYGICRLGCDPLGDNCPAEQTCVQGDTEFSCVTTTDNAGVGEECQYGNQCAPGLLCLETGGSGCSGGDGCCADPCSVGGDDCPKDEACEEILHGVGACN